MFVPGPCQVVLMYFWQCWCGGICSKEPKPPWVQSTCYSMQSSRWPLVIFTYFLVGRMGHSRQCRELLPVLCSGVIWYQGSNGVSSVQGKHLDARILSPAHRLFPVRVWGRLVVVTPDSARGLVLAILRYLSWWCSETIYGTENQTWLNSMQGKGPTH